MEGTASLVRVDPGTGQLTDLLPGFGFASNIYALAFREQVEGNDIEVICDGAPNVTGFGATAEVLGSSLVSSGDLEIYSRRLPPNQFGMFVTGQVAGSTPVGLGTLCIASPAFRYDQSIRFSGPEGAARLASPSTS